MSLYELEKVDFMGYNQEEKIAYLVITDELDWTNEEKHIELLQEKINLYLSFIESDEVYERYPEVKGYGFVIKIFGKYLLLNGAKNF
ncbi:DUF6572 domain-containing protein [Bacillus paramycoides]|uniref:DUF6572 domain-containing protein n=1 Tax=Bacillus paramycoides TaxID=2026194 RepID=UPI003182EF76